MQKRTSKKNPDTVQNALRVVMESTSEPVPQAVISQVMAEMGRKGGKIGGKRRLETMTANRRSEIASQAAKARWTKKSTKA